MVSFDDHSSIVQVPDYFFWISEPRVLRGFHLMLWPTPPSGVGRDRSLSDTVVPDRLMEFVRSVKGEAGERCRRPGGQAAGRANEENPSFLEPVLGLPKRLDKMANLCYIVRSFSDCAERQYSLY
jgi:hypothetical protein